MRKFSLIAAGIAALLLASPVVAQTCNGCYSPATAKVVVIQAPAARACNTSCSTAASCSTSAGCSATAAACSGGAGFHPLKNAHARAAARHQRKADRHAALAGQSAGDTVIMLVPAAPAASAAPAGQPAEKLLPPPKTKE